MTAPIQPDMLAFPEMPDDVCMVQLMTAQNGQMLTSAWVVQTGYLTTRGIFISEYGTPFAEAVIDANASVPAIAEVMNHPDTQVVYDE